jgi:glycosyltransferase involved in cell wall biosynthesis
MKKILHVIPVVGRGGAPIMLARLARALTAERGYRHEILALRELDHFEHDFESLGVPLHSLQMRSPVPDRRTLGALRDVVRRASPDVIHGWMYHGNIAAVLGAPLGTPVLWSVRHALHANQGEKLLTRALIRLGPLMTRRVERIVFCSETSARQHFDIGYPAARSVVIPNGVDTGEFCPAPEGRHARRIEVGLPWDGTLIGHAGRYHPVKNHLGLVRAFARVAHRYPHTTLVMAGRDVETANDQLLGSIREQRLENRVLLLGERSDMSRLLPALDLYVSPSHSEAFPVGLLEAMACGLPAVATDVGDSRALVGDAGRIIPAGNDGALSRGMEALVALDTSARQTLGERARFRVTDVYSLGHMADSYARLYERVTAHATRTSKAGSRPAPIHRSAAVD